MKYLAILLVFVVGISAECEKEKSEACVADLVASALGDDSDEETCNELEKSIDCLKAAMNECPGEEAEEVVEGLKVFEDVLEKNCKTQAEPAEVDEDLKNCATENEDYILECIQVAATQALTHAKESGKEDIDENSLTCGVYALMSSCLIERITEKCGEAAGMIAVEELVDMPDEIAEACAKTEGFVSKAIEALEDKRKK